MSRTPFYAGRARARALLREAVTRIDGDNWTDAAAHIALCIIETHETTVQSQDKRVNMEYIGLLSEICLSALRNEVAARIPCSLQEYETLEARLLQASRKQL
jgi:hypothetical protein